MIGLGISLVRKKQPLSNAEAGVRLGLGEDLSKTLNTDNKMVLQILQGTNCEDLRQKYYACIGSKLLVLL